MKFRNLALALGLAFSASAWASHIECINSNIDLWNRTGQAANDLEIRIGGITAAQVGSSVCGGFYNGPFGTPTVTESAGVVTIRWSGATIANNSMAHVGYSLLGNPAFTSYSVTWTDNGNVIPPVPTLPLPDAGQYWNGRSRDVLTNFGSSSVWVQRRGLTSPGIGTLGQLLPGGTLDGASVAIDATPQLLTAGSALFWDFAQNGSVTESYVMIYDVFADDGGVAGTLLATYLNDQVFIPEPGTLGLGVLGAALLFRRRKLGGH